MLHVHVQDKSIKILIHAKLLRGEASCGNAVYSAVYADIHSS